MARKLKVYITNLGFFELALAAPSMKAALEAWGLGHNAFHQGFARETDDARIVAAAMAKPGVVLKRPVGGKGAFSQNAALPKDWAPDAGGALPKPARKMKAKPKSKAAPKSKARPDDKSIKDDKAGRAAIISFEKEKARRAREREKDDARQEAQAEKERRLRERDAEKAQAALDRAQARHDDAMAEINAAQDKLDRRAALEKTRWDEERDDLKAALRKARD